MGFRFKQFTIEDDQCAMKVGTDGAMLGCWSQATTANNVLDIGTGSGLLALMLAQKMSANGQITGVELDKSAATQAQQNVSASPWPDKVAIVNQDIKLFAAQSQPSFDWIVSNPPYFESGQDINEARQAARHTEHLTWSELFTAIDQLLTAQGTVELVIPHQGAQQMITIAAQHQFSCQHYCQVKSSPSKPYVRSLMRFARQTAQTETTQLSELTIYQTNLKSKNPYTEQFIALVTGYYLKY